MCFEIEYRNPIKLFTNIRKIGLPCFMPLRMDFELSRAHSHPSASWDSICNRRLEGLRVHFKYRVTACRRCKVVMRAQSL